MFKLWAYHFINIVFLAVSRVILAQRAHQDHAHEADEEYHHHERIENWKPVNLPQQTHQCHHINIYVILTSPSWNIIEDWNIYVKIKWISSTDWKSNSSINLWHKEKQKKKSYTVYYIFLIVWHLYLAESLTRCWKKLGSRYLSNRSMYFMFEACHLTWRTYKLIILLPLINLLSIIFVTWNHLDRSWLKS